MEGREMVFALLGVIFVSLALNYFYVDMASQSGLTEQVGLNTQYFNKTNEMVGYFEEMKNETNILQDIPLIGDVVALLGNAIRAINILYSLPGIFLNMVSEAAGIIGIPAWVTALLNAFVWAALIFIIVSAMLRFRT